MTLRPLNQERPSREISNRGGNTRRQTRNSVINQKVPVKTAAPKLTPTDTISHVPPTAKNKMIGSTNPGNHRDQKITIGEFSRLPCIGTVYTSLSPCGRGKYIPCRCRAVSTILRS